MPRKQTQNAAKKISDDISERPEIVRKGANMFMSNDLIQKALGEIQRSAREMPAAEFFEQLDAMVESSRRFIESFDDDETRGRLREVFRGIVRYALDCKVRTSTARWN